MNDQDPNNNSQEPKGRKPDHAAYNVQSTKQGKAIWNRIGSAWQHSDGQGFEIDLHSTPIDGRVTVRELREQAHQQLDDQRQDMNQAQDQQQALDHNPTHGRSR